MADPETAKPATKTVNKAAFVRALSKDMPAAEVVAKAKAQGLTLSAAHVHAIRSAAKAARKKKRAGAPTKAAPSKASAPAKVSKASKAKVATPKKPAKGGAPKGDAAFGSKKAFVESLPRTMKAADVVAAGKKAGLSISPNYVWVLRSTTGAKSTAKRGPGRPKGSKNKAPASTPSVSSVVAKQPAAGSSLEATLRRLILDHGRNRVREELAKVEASVSRLLGSA